MSCGGGFTLIEFRCKLPRRAFTLDIALQVNPASVYSIFGPSAAGKSSVLSVIAGFENRLHTAYLSVNGRVLIDVKSGHGLNVSAWRRGVVLMEQGATLFPHLSVRDNIYFGVRTKRDPWIEAWIERVGLGPYLDAKPSQLSGGLTQRAVIVRSIVGRPEILLLDEPFSALDWSLRRILQDAVMDLQNDLGTTIIMVTHDLAEAQRMADEMAILNHGQILQYGAPEHLMMHPKSWEVAKLLGYTHLLTDGNGQTFAFHPSRVVPEAQPDLGPVLQGTVKEQFLHEADRRVAVYLSSFNCELEIAVPTGYTLHIGQTFAFTVVNPPYVY